MNRVIVLNQDYSFLNTISWKKAMCLIVKGKVEVVKNSKRLINIAAEHASSMFVPLVIRLVKMVRRIYKTRVPFSKKNVIYRDKNTCQFCGAKPRKLTIDHVIPKSKGGRTNFENCVAACKPCNNKKGDKFLRDINMTLKRKPFQPTIMEFINIKMRLLGVEKVLDEIWTT